jgi:cytoskeletal protein CcmA (bactofilin family)
MIRMGRSNRVESEETPQVQESYSSNNLYSGQQEPTPANRSSGIGGAVSESESIARDIKEGRLSGFIGHGTVQTGEMNFQAMLRVDGHLTGRVTSESGTLIIGTSGRVDANILVATAVVNGAVNGDIIALEKIELGRSAQVVGNIQAPRLTIVDGAILEGSCSMVKAKESLDQRTAEKQQQKYNQQTETYTSSSTSGYGTSTSSYEEPATTTDEDEEAETAAA